MFSLEKTLMSLGLKIYFLWHLHEWSKAYFKKKISFPFIFFQNMQNTETATSDLYRCEMYWKNLFSFNYNFLAKNY